jgi:PAS domain S-box-containing protein
MLQFDLVQADYLRAGLAYLTREKPSVVLIDFSLPDSHGVESIRRIHAQEPMVPIIVLASRGEEHLAFETIREGSEDYLIKECLQSQSLAHAIVCAIERHRIRRKAEEQLRKLSRAVEQSPSSIVITDLAGDIEYVNPKFTQVTGYTSDEVMGQNPRILKSGVMSQEEYKHLWDTITAGQEWRGEFHNKRKDGTLFWEMASISPVVDVNGVVTHFVGIKEDITKRKHTEAELQRAREEAISATRAKSVFLASMSHEIRTPLNAIIGMTTLLMNSDLPTDERDYVDTIRICSDALLNIINDVLDFSKIEAGRLELNNQPFSLRHCVEESLDVMATKAAEKRLDLSYDLAPNTPATLVGDEARLRQVLVNLLSNAVKFTERGEVVVSVQKEDNETVPSASSPAHPDLWTLHRLHFSVRDTGIGISPEQQSRLFQSFRQADTSVSRRYGGTGLGLAISKRLVELMGGTMWVESEVGAGATFHFTVEMKTVSHSSETQDNEAQNQTQPLAGKRVLIVDDNATAGRQLARSVQEWGMLPRVATSGEDVREWLRDGEPFDLALLDLHMPEIASGCLFHDHCTAHMRQPVPLVLITYVGLQKDAEWLARFPHPHAFLTRPIKPSRLYETLLMLLRGAGEGIRPTDRDRDTSETASPPPAHPGIFPRPLRVLVAEDNPFNQKVISLLLARLGYKSDIVGNGNEVLNRLEQQEYDVILMDIQMPDMDGFEATRIIRARLPERIQPWIIAMTAHAQPGDRKQCLDGGMDDYMSKPIQIDKLGAVLKRACEKRTFHTSDE